MSVSVILQTRLFADSSSKMHFNGVFVFIRSCEKNVCNCFQVEEKLVSSLHSILRLILLYQDVC